VFRPKFEWGTLNESKTCYDYITAFQDEMLLQFDTHVSQETGQSSDR
jgi:hypothetical protein